MDEQDNSGLIDRMTRVTEDAVQRVQHEVKRSPVVTATRDRARGAGRAAASQLPATRDDVVRLQGQLDRIEATLARLGEQIDALKPKRRSSAAPKSEG